MVKSTSASTQMLASAVQARVGARWRAALHTAARQHAAAAQTQTARGQPRLLPMVSGTLLLPAAGGLRSAGLRAACPRISAAPFSGSAPLLGSHQDDDSGSAGRNTPGKGKGSGSSSNKSVGRRESAPSAADAAAKSPRAAAAAAGAGRRRRGKNEADADLRAILGGSDRSRPARGAALGSGLLGNLATPEPTPSAMSAASAHGDDGSDAVGAAAASSDTLDSFLAMHTTDGDDSGEANEPPPNIASLLEEGEEAMQKYSTLQLYTFLYGRDRPIPDDFESYVTDEALKREMRYLFPSQLKLANLRPPVQRPKFSELPESHPNRNPQRRPSSPAFFTGRPEYYDLMQRFEDTLDQLNAEAAKDPEPEDSTRDTSKLLAGVSWMKKDDLEHVMSLRLRLAEYRLIVSRLNELWVHPKSHLVRDSLLRPFLREGAKKATSGEIVQPKRPAANGQAYAIGRRKEAVARVWMKSGSGHFRINGKTLGSYFPLARPRLEAIEPLRLLAVSNKFDIEARVAGGGATGQAGALRLGVSRALQILSANYRAPLKRAGLLTRDTRRVERKKPGQKKARKKFQWVKR